MWVTCDRSVVFSGPSTNKTNSHDITEILLKVVLNTIKQTNNKPIYLRFIVVVLNSSYCYAFYWLTQIWTLLLRAVFGLLLGTKHVNLNDNVYQHNIVKYPLIKKMFLVWQFWVLVVICTWKKPFVSTRFTVNYF